MRTFAIIAAALLAGCAGSASMRAPELSTQAIKQDLLSHRNTMWKDPSSIREASIGQAYSCSKHSDFSGTPVTCICVETNGKNSFGGYTGMQKRIAVYRASTLISYEDWDFGDRCDDMQPFPELNGDYATAVARKRQG